MDNNGAEHSDPNPTAMTRMAELLGAFAEVRTTRKPLCFSVDGETMYMEEHAAIEPFVRLIYDDGWMLTGFDWMSWDEGREIVGNPARVKNVDLLTIRKIITALVRRERFCDGTLQAAYEHGVIEAILRRIGQLSTEDTEGDDSMDAFEQIVAMILKRNGYWVQTSYKVCLTKAEKKKIGIPTSPRWELDVIAYRPKDNVILVVECKSFLNSVGVGYKSFSGKNKKGAKRYKLFTNPKLRKTVFSRMKKQLKKAGMILPYAKVKLCLAAGHINKRDEEKIKQHCEKKGWGLFAKDWFGEQFDKLAEAGYENDIAIVAAKLAKAAAD